MKKFFLFAAAAVAAMTVNAKVISFAEIIDKTDAASAKSTCDAAFSLINLTSEGKPNSKGTAYCAEITQTEATTEWNVSLMMLKSDEQAYFTFKDANANKLVAKVWNEYIQPNGGGMCLVITDLSNGDKVKLTLKEAVGSEPVVDGATGTFGSNTEVELTATANEIHVYSKDAGGAQVKWKLISVEVPGGSQGFENADAAVKAEKFYRNGQLIIRKNGVEYNALGAQL